MKTLTKILATILITAAFAFPAQAVLEQRSGRVTFLRVHDVGTGFSAGANFIDVEVVIRLNGDATRAFGFQLRNDANQAARQGMLELLRDAFNNNWTVTIDYDRAVTSNNGVIIRTALTRP